MKMPIQNAFGNGASQSPTLDCDPLAEKYPFLQP